MIKKCDICNKEFNALSSTKSCSPECRLIHRKRYQEKWCKDNSPVCSVCGKQHGYYQHKFLYPNRKTMCKKCYLESCKGPLNHQWKGGRRLKGKKGTNCYVEIYAPDHPRATRRYVLEHIIIWEKENKKQLPKGFVIHHLNGIKYDNRVENLIAVPRSKHHGWLVNSVLQDRIKELESRLH